MSNILRLKVPSSEYVDNVGINTEGLFTSVLYLDGLRRSSAEKDECLDRCSKINHE
jgi:hypothetical protein